MSVLTVRVSDVEDGEVEVKITTTDTPDLNNPTPAEYKMAMIVKTLEAAANDPKRTRTWLESCTVH